MKSLIKGYGRYKRLGYTDLEAKVHLRLDVLLSHKNLFAADFVIIIE
jgi:hypothetical protein